MTPFLVCLMCDRLSIWSIRNVYRNIRTEVIQEEISAHPTHPHTENDLELPLDSDIWTTTQIWRQVLFAFVTRAICMFLWIVCVSMCIFVNSLCAFLCTIFMLYIFITFSWVTLFMTFVLSMDVCVFHVCFSVLIYVLHILNIVCTPPHYERWHTKRKWLCS